MGMLWLYAAPTLASGKVVVVSTGAFGLIAAAATTANDPAKIPVARASALNNLSNVLRPK
jgi:hypothetical protein